VGGHPPTVALRLDASHLGHPEPCSCGLRLLHRHGAEVVSRNAVGEARNALDRVDADEQAARRPAGQDERLPAQPAGGRPPRQPRDSPTGNEEVDVGQGPEDTQAVSSGDRLPARLIVLCAALSAFGPLSMDAYLPALPSLGRGLDASASAVGATLTA